MGFAIRKMEELFFVVDNRLVERKPGSPEDRQQIFRAFDGIAIGSFALRVL